VAWIPMNPEVLRESYRNTQQRDSVGIEILLEQECL
jgi:hypothetical protein